MKKILLCISCLLLFIYLYSCLTYASENNKSNNEISKINVVIASIVKDEIVDSINSLGTTVANESVDITSKVSEYIVSVHFNDGDNVYKNQVLLTLQNSEQLAVKQAASVSLGAYNREYNRIQGLVHNKVIAEHKLDEYATLIDTTKAELLKVKSALDERIIRSPFDGKLGIRHVSVGAFVSPDTIITTLDDTSLIKLDFYIPERFIDSININNLIEATSDAFPQSIFKGYVTSISSRVDKSTRSVMVRAEIPNKNKKLIPGMLMNVKLVTKTYQSLVIPEAGVQSGRGGSFAYVVNENNIVIKKEIVTGLRKSGTVEVRNGLNENEVVVIRGALKIKPGDKVVTAFEERLSDLISREG